VRLTVSEYLALGKGKSAKPTREGKRRGVPKPKPKTRKDSPGEEALAAQLEADGYSFEREVRFAPPRRWRLDFVVERGCSLGGSSRPRLAIEVQGGVWVGGSHSRGAGQERDCEKAMAAALAGYVVVPVTTRQAKDGTAMAFVDQWFGKVR
jgi:hypothetical protein